MNKGEFRFEGDAPAFPPFRVELWGDLAVTGPDGDTLTPRSRKARALLAWLALHPGRRVSRERLCGLLWGDRGEEQARASLRQALFELKPFTTGPAPLLQVERSHITLDSTRLETDLDRLAAGAANPPDVDECFLADLDDIDEGFDDWLRTTRARLGDARPTAPPDPTCRSDGLPSPLATGLADASPPEPAAPETGADPDRRRFALPGLLALLLLVALVALAVPALQSLRPGAVPAGGPAAGPVTLAVLPFRPGPDPGDPGRAEALAGELRRLVPPGDRVRTLGGFSSSLPDVASLTPLAAGRRLEATHVLAGTVATRGGTSEVTASLTRIADGRALWTHRFDVPADRLLDLREPIGTAIVASLGLAPTPGAGAMPRPDVYALVAAARELMNSLELAKIEAATVLLRKALALDPEDPGANAALAIALLDRNLLEFSNDGASARHAEALQRAQKALARAPDLADAQFAMGFASASREVPEAGLAYYEAAVRLDPGRAEYWMHLADIRERTGRYADSMAALRRAVALEPFWWPAFYQSAEMAWDLGDRAESIRIAERTIRGTGAFQQTMVRSDMAWRTGDFSETWRLGNRAVPLAGEGQQRFARFTMGRALRAAGLMDRARQVWSFYPIDEAAFALWHGKPPPPAAFAATTADIERFWSTTPEPNLLFRTLVREGRNAELVAIYRRSGGTPAALRRRYFGLMGFLEAVPPLVIALRAAGRPDQADALGAEARAAIDPVLAAGAVPTSLIILDSQILMLEGDRAGAIARLQEAAARGWLQARARSFPDMADEPAWRPLVGDPGFERIRAREQALVARERAEILAQSAGSALN